MAKIQDTTKQNINSFNKGLNKDSDPSFVGEGMWTHARNAANNTREGDLGSLSNEISNIFCAEAGATLGNATSKRNIIGSIYLYSDKWVVFTVVYNSTGLGAPIGHEVGLYEEDSCRYRIIVQDPCLNFSKYNLISGASREKEDCSWAVYFSDSFNPDRVLNIGDPLTWPPDDYIWVSNNQYSDGVNIMQWPGVAWNTVPELINSCYITTNLQTLDCDAIRLARLMQPPCLSVSLGVGAGTLRNGSYSACLAYSIKGQKVTDYFSLSNIQPVYSDRDLEGTIDIHIEADSDNFAEFILVVVSTINQQTTAKQIGIYSTKTTVVSLDQIKEDLISVPIEQIPIRTPVFEKSDQIIEVNNYLLRVGPTSKFDFNYQPLANLIETEWVSVEYSADYYNRGGSNTSYLRDEVYAFFIRWVYDTGDKSNSYHIPGRAAEKYAPLNVFENQTASGSINKLAGDNFVFQVVNTASQTSTVQETLPDGGVVIARGKMGYWQSTEIYPDNKPEVWNASSNCFTGVPAYEPNQGAPYYDLCGKPIRHHKFPDNALSPQTFHFTDTNGSNPNGERIRVMGVNFRNITFPKDNEGNDIPGIVGYEILRGSREGNRSIIAKGMLNNLRSYGLTTTLGETTTGLYPNYPFNTIKPYGSILGGVYNDPYIRATDSNNNDVSQTVPTNIISFHSPDTTFRSPFLSVSELKLYGNLQGLATNQFVVPMNHPQFKLLGNKAVFPMFIAGIIEAMISFAGEFTVNKSPTDASGIAKSDPALAAGSGAWGISQTIALATWGASNATYNGGMKQYFRNGGLVADGIIAGFTGQTPIRGTIDALYATAFNTTNAITGALTPSKDLYSYVLPKTAYLDPVTRALASFQNFVFYFSEGADVALRIIYATLPYRDFALQSIAYGFYNQFFAPLSTAPQRFNVEDGFYLKDSIQNVPEFSGTRYRINNLKRTSTVILRTTDYQNNNNGPRYILGPGEVQDNSLFTLGTAIDSFNPNEQNTNGINWSNNKTLPFNTNIASHYAGIKVKIDNQYGQLQSIKQLPVTFCEQKVNPADYEPISTGLSCGNNPVFKKVITQTPIFFGGDTYINRYAEKNSMLFFYDWLYGQPDGFSFNYAQRFMIPEARFWLNSEPYTIGQLAELFSEDSQPDEGEGGGGFFSKLQNAFNTGILKQIKDLVQGINNGTGPFPNSFFNLDNNNYNYSTNEHGKYKGLFGVREAYFYIANSSVRDFFVESEVIVDFRESGDSQWQKPYIPYKYTDISSMFTLDPNVIAKGDYWAYDYSLSATKLFTQYFSQGSLQSRYYDPNVAKLCYTYYPDRIIYSLPQTQESFKDSWFIYLANNYKEFKTQISGVKNFAKTGIFITFKNSSPLVFQGVDQLQTEGGIKITIGDGGLFNQTPQSVVIADDAYEYGSSQNRRSVISTPAGMFYMSQNQGKIFSYSQGLSEISANGLKWWFNIFMPYKLTLDFPNYPHVDNPVGGIGCQSIYDNQNGILYFCKKDYKLKPEYVGRVEFNRNKNAFILDGTTKYDLGSKIFEDASWTVSYDPKSKFWISFHDWHPDLVLPSKNTFITTKGSKLYFHNNVCNSYCNYYGVDYPFEVEVPISTGQTVTTLRSVEYIMEAVKRADNCFDQFQVLDYNFDRAVIYNAEQVSGYLALNIFPKNNVSLSLDYPKLNSGVQVEPGYTFPAFDILFSKEENKYRFNQFWDITKDRGEFPIGSDYPPTGPVIPGTTVLAGPHTQENIWVTQSNGYIKTLNPANLDYTKELLQRKKFRDYLNYLYLRKDVSGDINMTIKLASTKNQISLR
jgi:hypothetical protein